MKIDATAIDAWPLAARMSSAIGSADNIWYAVVSEPQRQEEAADALIVELESLDDEPIRRAFVDSAESFLSAVQNNPDDTLLLTLSADWHEQQWRIVDMQRSWLMRKGMTIILAEPDDVAAMVTAAPNLWSWIGGLVWALRMEEEPDV